MAEDTPTLLAQARLRNKKPGPTCGVATVIQEHPLGPQVSEVIDACRTHEIQYTTAVNVFNEAGIQLRSDSISRHVRGQCACRVAA